MRKPTIHLNGTSREELLSQYFQALMAVKAAIGALPMPHGRDYYPQDGNALSEALDEHENRLKLLRRVEKEIREIAEAISFTE